MQIIAPFEALDDLLHKAARLIINGKTLLSARMNEADSAAVEKETVAAEIFRMCAIERPFSVGCVPDDRMCKMFEMTS